MGSFASEGFRKIITTVIQVLLFAKHRVDAIVIRHMYVYRQTAAMHNKFPEMSGNFPLILNFRKIYDPIMAC